MAHASIFVQVLQGRAADPGAIRDLIDRWHDELAPGAVGWLGTTAGVSDDDEFVALIRFASAEAAARSSQREEQDAWWHELASHIDGDLEAHDCEDVAEIAGGGSDDAGFVQVFRGRATQLHEVLDRIAETAEEMLSHRPVLIGGYVAAHDEGDGFTEVLYYPSEEQAEGEEGQEVRETELTRVAEMAGAVTDLRRIDLRDPWLRSA